jgi:hypothetical protein
MNDYDAAHRNMVYSDVELGTVRVTSLGAWPTHLAIQSLVVAQWDLEERPLSIALLDMSTQLYDWVSYGLAGLSHTTFTTGTRMAFPEYRDLNQLSCLAEPHFLGRPALKPRLNPVSESPQLTQDIHGCSYSLPGIDISSDDKAAILQAPMPGYVTTFTDHWHNTTIRIENDEWIIWLLHPRSYLVEEGNVRRGQPVGVMGAVGYATGPHVHYTIYDKRNETFVDPRLFLP